MRKTSKKKTTPPTAKKPSKNKQPSSPAGGLDYKNDGTIMDGDTLMDVDKDGVVSEEEVDLVSSIRDVHIREDKHLAQKKMAWIALMAMIAFTIALLLPIMPVDRIKALADVFGLMYIGMAGVVGAYMGMTAYISQQDAYGSRYRRRY